MEKSDHLLPSLGSEYNVIQGVWKNKACKFSIIRFGDCAYPCFLLISFFVKNFSKGRQIELLGLRLVI